MVSDDDDDAGGPLDRNWPEDTPAPPLGAYDDEDEDTLDLQATQWITKRNHEYQDNTASAQGVIEEVFCRNFMCHSKLRIKLGPLINFVIGHNGSGKSAVLTALTMCLGGKASSTNRGASLKSLIKEGEDSATLSVKIKNEGEGAYKHALYGDSIIVERHFTRAGTSGFKLKNANDKLISNKKPISTTLWISSPSSSTTRSTCSPKTWHGSSCPTALPVTSTSFSSEHTTGGPGRGLQAHGGTCGQHRREASQQGGGY